ncbi:glucosaminidase domain-containing protein [Clostridium sp.]|uniref:glucosaminidase domain-containing protein n=1 Tax=Clostridium sp. TaxID=1506 RepID=UPI0039A0C1D2
MSIIKNGSRDLVKNKESTSIYGSASFKLEGKSIIKDSEYNTEINKSFVNRSTSEQSLDKVINNERIYKVNNESLNKPQYFKNGYGDTGSRRELISRIEYPYKSSQYTRATIKREERINDRTYSLLNGKENNYKARKNSLIDDKRIDSIIKIKEVDTRGNSLRKNNITSNITKRSESVIRENGFKNSANYVNSKLDGIIRVREERVSETIIKRDISETIIKNNIPNIKNYDIQGNRRKSLNIVRNDKLKAKGRYTNLIEDLKYTRSVNFSRVKKEFFKARYIRTIVDNGIDNLNSSDNDYGNTLAKEKMYRIVSAPRDLIRAGRSLKRAYNGARYVKDVSKNLKNISDIKSIKLKRIVGKGITTSLINEVNSLKGNENIGIQSIVKTKDTLVTTKNTLRYSAKATKKATKLTKNTFDYGARGIKQVKKFTKFGYDAGKKLTIMATKLFSNPVVLKVLAVLGAVVVALSLIGSIFIGFISIFIGENSNIDFAVPNEEQRAFILKLVPIAQDNYNDYGIFPSVTIAQAIHESAWGKSDLSVKANNLFGVKADSSWKGQTIDMPTQEHINGSNITVMAKWRKYDSFEDSVKDHGKFLKENPRYEQSGVFKAKDYKEQAYAIRMAGYATDPQYASLICNIIESYSLNIYDFKVGDGNKVVERAITTGMSIVGKSPYVFGGGRNPEDIAALRFDCSSFVHWCYANAGLNLGDYRSVVTWTLVTMGREVKTEEMQRGDLIFFNTEGVVNNHVGIYLGDNKFLHDASTNGVWVNNLEGYWKNAFNGTVRRVVE